MKKLLGLFLLLAVMASAADAAAVKTYFVRVGAGNSGTGRSYADAWGTIAKANAIINTAGVADSDVVVLLFPSGVSGNPYAGNGQFSEMPNPANAATSGKRYRFYSGTWSHRIDAVELYEKQDELAGGKDSAITVLGGVSTKKYLTIAGVNFSTSFEFGEGALFDSALFCRTPGTGAGGKSLSIQGGDRCTIAHCLIRCADFWQGGTQCFSNTYDSNYWPYLGKGIKPPDGNGNAFFTTGQGGGHWDSTTFTRNLVSITREPEVVIPDKHPRLQFLSSYGTYKYNRYDITNLSIYGGRYGMAFRDSCHNNTIVGDTIIMRGPGDTVNEISISGHDPTGGQWINDNFGTTIDSCYFFCENGPALSTQESLDRVRVTNSVFASATHNAAEFLNLAGNAYFRHNTFVGFPRGTGVAGLVSFENNGTYQSYPDTLTFMENILYSLEAATSPPCSPTGSMLSIGARLVDSLTFYGSDAFLAPRKHRIKYNLYSYYGDQVPFCNRTCLGDRAVLYGSCLFSCGGSDSTKSAWFKHYKQDSLSVYGSPQFDAGGSDTTAMAWADPRASNQRIGYYSKARGAGVKGSDIGAWSYSLFGIPRLSQNWAGFQAGVSDSRTIILSNVAPDGDYTFQWERSVSSNPDYDVSPYAYSDFEGGVDQYLQVRYTGTDPAHPSSAVIRLYFSNSDTPYLDINAFATPGGNGLPSGD